MTEGYRKYLKYCGQLEVTPASQARYEHEVSQVNAEASGFNRHGRDLLLHSGKKLRHAFVLRIGEALGVADEAAMLTMLGLTDALGNVTAAGENVSRVRMIEGAEYRLWALDKVGRMLGKAIEGAQESESEPAPAPEPELQEFLVSNAVLDTFPAPELEAA